MLLVETSSLQTILCNHYKQKRLRMIGRTNKLPKITKDRQQEWQTLLHTRTSKVRSSFEFSHYLHTATATWDYDWVHSNTSVHFANRSRYFLQQTHYSHWHEQNVQKYPTCYHFHPQLRKYFPSLYDLALHFHKGKPHKRTC